MPSRHAGASGIAERIRLYRQPYRQVEERKKKVHSRETIKNGNHTEPTDSGHRAPHPALSPKGEREPDQMADSPFSPVRMRMASPMGSTNTLPSPMEPVLAAEQITATTFSTIASATTTSTLTFGRKSMVYSEPR